MSWLFWVLLIILALFAVQGFRKGLVRTAVSMVFFIIVIGVTSWLNPYVGDFIREKTDWQESIQEGCKEILFQEIGAQTDISGDSQGEFIEALPLPESMKEILAENNTVETYRKLAVENFADYLSGYVAYGIINGIAFIVSLIITVIIVKLILYAVDILTELPVVGTLNRVGGMLAGLIQGMLWIWVAFLVITLLCNTSVGAYLMDLIRSDPVLGWMYNRNYLMDMIMRILV